MTTEEARTLFRFIDDEDYTVLYKRYGSYALVFGGDHNYYLDPVVYVDEDVLECNDLLAEDFIVFEKSAGTSIGDIIN